MTGLLKLSLSLFLCLTSSTIRSAPTPLIGDEIVVDSSIPTPNVSGAARRFGLAYNSQDDEFLVAWHGTSAQGDSVVRVQRVGSDSIPLGPEIDIATPEQIDKISPQVAYNPQDNQYLLVFENGAVLDQYILSASVEIVSSTPVGLNTGADKKSDPHVAWGSNHWMIVWRDTTGSGSAATHAVTVQFVHPNGVPDGTVLQLNAAGEINNMGPRVAYNPVMQKFLIVAMGADYVTLRGYLVDEVILGATTPLVLASISALSQGLPDLAVDPDPVNPRFLVTWSGYDLLWDFSLQTWVKGRFVDADGPVGTEVLTLQQPAAPQLLELQASIAFSPDVSEYVLLYELIPDSTSSSSVFAKRFDSNAIALDVPEQVGTPLDSVLQPSIAAGSGGKFICAYHNQSSDLIARIYATTLNPPDPSPGEDSSGDTGSTLGEVESTSPPAQDDDDEGSSGCTASLGGFQVGAWIFVLFGLIGISVRNRSRS